MTSNFMDFFDTLARLPRLREPCAALFLAEGLTVGALIDSGVHLVSTHQDAVQRAVILVFAMMRALLDGALNALIGMTVHVFSSFELGSAIVWRDEGKVCWKTFPILHFRKLCGMLRTKEYKL